MNRVDGNRYAFLALLCVAAGAEFAAGQGQTPKADPLAARLAAPVLADGTALREIREAVLRRIPVPVRPDDAGQWTAESRALRGKLLREVVYQGTPAAWIDAKPQVKWGETIDTSEGYRIRKLLYEGYPGLWIPAALYEPTELRGKVPAVYNTNGHVGAPGKAVAYKQLRCINLAKRGMLALNAEWIGMGQLSGAAYSHRRLAYLDLCGRSGLGVFYMSMKRALDVLCDHPNADPERIGVTGLSGGGWQTILISALDERVRLCAPNAGYIGLAERLDHRGDIGDLEQNPVDLVASADYTHLTALLAPRPALLIYNEKDNCCFAAPRAKGSVYDPIVPFYRLYDAADAFAFHENTDPGTHNYDLDNRQQFYRFVNRHWLPAAHGIDDEIDSADEVLGREALDVPLPLDNATFRSLALAAAKALPKRRLPSAGELKAWQRESRKRLREVVRFTELEARSEGLRRVEEGDYEIAYYKVHVGDAWTLPASVLRNTTTDPRAVAIVVADGGRGDGLALKRKLADEGCRVVSLDVLLIGDCVAPGAPGAFGQMLGTVGLRPLGIQAAQILAAARLAVDAYDQDAITLVGFGQGASVAALVAAALDTDTVDRLLTHGLPSSLERLIEEGVDYNRYPALFCFGLLEQFDVRELLGLVAPRRVEHVDRRAGQRE